MLGLSATFHPFIGFPSYKKIAHLPLAERVACMGAEGFKAQILTEQSEPVAGDGSPLPPLADYFLSNIDMVAMRLFRLGESPNYEPGPTESLGAEARMSGKPILSVLFDAMLEDEGQALTYFPVYNYTGMNLDVCGEMITHPLALPGLSDGGAHVGTICDASFPTFLLTHWTRDRAEGKISLERAIQMQCHDTARFLGLLDRGTLAIGQRADINIIDMKRLRLHHPILLADLPAGGQRLMQHADGYVATLVAGEVIAREGKLTGARPGRMVRVGTT